MFPGSATLTEQTRKKCRVRSQPDQADSPEDPTGVWPPIEAQPQRTAVEHNQRGAAQYAMGDVTGALAEFNKALELDCNLPEAYNNRAFSRESLGDTEGAFADFDRAIAIRPDYVDAYCNRGATRHACGSFEAALADFDAALKLVPRSAAAPIYHGRAGVFLTRRDFDAAIADLNEALLIDPRLWPAYVSRANARYHTSDPGAADDYWMALQLNPDQAAREIIRKLADDLNQNDRAVLVNCERHLRANRADRLSLARRGLTLLLLGRDAEATRDLANFVQLGPHCEPHLRRLIDEVLRRRAEIASRDKN